VSIVVIAIYLPIAAVLLFGPVINVTPTYALSGVDVPNPFVLPLLEGLGGESLGTTPIWTSLFVIQLVAVVAFLARFRRSIGLERLQYRWLAWAMIVVAIANAVWALVTIVVRPDSAILAMVIVAISYPAIPVAVVIAVLRYRLYDIDRLVSRTLGWGIASAAVVGVFVGAVLALQAVLSGVTQSGTLVVAASTLLAFAAFQPVRLRVQSVVDRRFDRPRLEAERILAGHGERLRHETDLERIEVGVLGTISETLRPSSATVWIRPVSTHGP
jgi:hypothetical protein